MSVFWVALVVLLAGYMFLGRGFAHVGRPPLYVGEVVLLVGLITATVALVRWRSRVELSPLAWVLIGFMALGAVHTLPYLTTYGVDALRDAVLWGYAFFALIVYVLAKRSSALGALRLYGWVVPIFAIWLPIAFNVFVNLSAGIGSDELGSNIPLLFFKSGDMAVHIVGSIAFLVLGAGSFTSLRTLAWRAAITVPLLWTAFVAGATNRGGLVTVAIGLAVIAALGLVLQRSRNWLPIIAGPALVVALLGVGGIVSQQGTATSAPTPDVSPSASSGVTPPASEAPTASPAPTCDPAPASHSLVGNPGFEVGTLMSGMVDEWATWSGTYNIVGGGGYRGANYASMQNPGEPWTASITSTRFPFQAGHVISVSAQVKAIEGAPVVATYVNWYDGAGTLLSGVLLQAVATDGSPTWRQSTGNLTAPPSTTHAEVQLYETAGTAAAGIDEVIATSATTTCDPAPASRSLVANPGFEVGTLASGAIDEWATWSGSYNIVADGYRGANYASMQNPGEPWMASMTSTRFPFQAGHIISVSARVKALEGAPVLATYVNWYDGAGSLISGVLLKAVATDGSPTWRESTGSLTAPPSTTDAEVQLYETAGNATVGVDEVIALRSEAAEVPEPEGRPATFDQIVENVTSIFSSTDDKALEGTKAFRLRWWTAIVQYTVFGDYFWTGKGFGVNLADADGFQTNIDRSLRAPHNSHISALARMGVPGFAFWLVVQGAFAVGLVRSVLVNRRAGDLNLAAVGAWVLAYWVAMMVNTSFDPYLEGPQGGIWFWSLFGLGMVVMHLTPSRSEA